MLFSRQVYNAVLAGTVAVLLFQPQLAESAFKQTRDTWVLCDVAQNCTINLKATSTDGAPSFAIYRSSEIGSTPQMRWSNADFATLTGKAAISVDGKEVLSVELPSFSEDTRQYDYNNAVNVAKLVTDMKRGHKLSFTSSGKTFSYSLDGFVAGLIYMDEQQSRDGTVDAIQVKGTKPAPQPPAVKIIESFDQIPDDIRPIFVEEDSACGTTSEAVLSSASGFSASIAEGLDLLALPCGAPGAYNQPYVFFSRADGKSTPISLPVIGDEGPTITDDAWNIDWTQKNKTLTAFFRGRGLGDCGSYNVWKATDSTEGRVRFVLLEERNKDECDGNYAGGPQKWPADWPIKTK